MKKALIYAAAIALLGLSMTAQATITIDTVTVGDPGNVADATGYGAVSYTYSIGKYEVTAGQYTAFLNAVAATDTYGLYNISMATSVNPYGCNISRTGSAGNHSYSVASDWANRPVNFVSYWDSCRFANWLHNGQPTGTQDATTTERGAYTLDGYTGTDGRTIQRNAGWTWAVTSEDEWYKAAYYKGGGTNAGYWLFPTQNDGAPGRDLNDASGNNANYYDPGNPYPIQSPYYTTVVGQFQNSDTAYGTFDQGGNIWEWNEAIPYQDLTTLYHGLRGGSFYGTKAASLASSYRYYGHPGVEYNNIGFRVSQVVPEPSSVIVLLCGFAGLIGLKRNRA